MLRARRRCSAVLAGTEQPPPGTSTTDHLSSVVRGASHGLVVLMAGQRWGCMELDSLPLGVGLPLREALQRCRGSPPPGEAWDRNQRVKSTFHSQMHMSSEGSWFLRPAFLLHSCIQRKRSGKDRAWVWGSLGCGAVCAAVLGLTVSL